MATPSEELISAVNADDADRVAALVADDPALAAVRDEHGVSAVLLSRYRFARPVTDALLAADPDLDVFDAAALGYQRPAPVVARRRIPALANAFASDGFTAAPPRGVLRQDRIRRGSCSTLAPR